MCSCQAFNAETHCLKKWYFRAVCLLNSYTVYLFVQLPSERLLYLEALVG